MSSAVPSCACPHAQEAVAVGAGCLWLQLGVVSWEAARIAHEGGLGVVMDRCTAIEHRQLATDGATRAARVTTGRRTAGTPTSADEEAEEDEDDPDDGDAGADPRLAAEESIATEAPVLPSSRTPPRQAS